MRVVDTIRLRVRKTRFELIVVALLVYNSLLIKVSLIKEALAKLKVRYYKV